MNNECPLVIGKWYYSTKWNGKGNISKFFAKYHSIINGVFSYSERYLEGKYQKYHSYTDVDNQDWESFHEVPMDILKKYLPKGHKDLKIKIHEIW